MSFTNKLINETSPYLLQHAHNPVNWYPWGDEAFRKAMNENKPIFLSIGYSTCHWCHVMEHESFEDVEVAEFLNEHFIAIKVDKEERPDIDSIYMSVCQAMTGSGGWPTTILMTPEQKPFYAATYLPKHSRYNLLGRYTVKETQAPSFYKLNTKPIDVTIEFATQIIKLEYTNESANVGVSIDKIGPKEVMQGQDAMYTTKTVRNNSTIPLNSFYWRDVLPTDAVRLTKIVTGTYSQSLKYKVLITTNKGNTRVIADNLMTTKNNVIGCTNAELGLPNDEYVTSFTLQFGTVKAGFSMVEEAKIYTKVLKNNLPTGYQFGNKVDVGGKSGNDWTIGNSTCVTTIYNPLPNQKLPKTGQ